MQIKYIKLYTFIALLSLVACEDRFDKVNKDNVLAPTVVPPDYLLTNIIYETTEITALGAWNIGILIMQQGAKFHSTDFDRYEWGTGSYTWDASYRNLRDCRRLYELGTLQGNESYQATALVMQSVLFMNLTDLFGDIPYTEALQGKEGNFQPVYDTQEAVYTHVLEDLAKASNMLSEQGASITGDLLYGGNLMQWKRFANALQLRLLMRISAKKDVSQALKSLVQQPLMQSVADDAGRDYLAISPYEYFVYRRAEGHFLGYRLSEFMGNYLQSTADERLSVLAQPTQASVEAGSFGYLGMPNGLSEGTASLFAGGSTHISLLGTRLREPNTEKANLMLYSEQQFLLAEAAERGLINGDPAQYYREGITADWMRYGLTPPNSYMTQEAVAYTGTSEEKLQKTGMQKWLALHLVGVEGWMTWRRTGIPNIQPAVENVNNNLIPVRFRYPESEQLLNATNYQEAVARQGADDLNTKLWVMP